jgi:hypothetical protein
VVDPKNPGAVMEFNKVNKITGELLSEIFSKITPQYDKFPKDRHMFGSAITPNGLVNEYETILQDCSKLYLIKGSPGTGKSTLIETIFKTAQRYGLDTEVFHCAFDPRKLDALYIPHLQIGVLNVSPPIKFDASKIDSNPKIIDLDQHVNLKIMSTYETEIKNADKRFWASIHRAVDYINKAKKLHDDMEKYYIPAMDFEAINARREETLQRILNYANK